MRRQELERQLALLEEARSAGIDLSELPWCKLPTPDVRRLAEAMEDLALHRSAPRHQQRAGDDLTPPAQAAASTPAPAEVATSTGPMGK